MASATVEGQWVLLQNTHLGLGYLTEVSLHCAFFPLHIVLQSNRWVWCLKPTASVIASCCCLPLHLVSCWGRQLL